MPINKQDIITAFRIARQQECRQIMSTSMTAGMSAHIGMKAMAVFNRQSDLYIQVLQSMGEPSVQLEDINLNELEFEDKNGKFAGKSVINRDSQRDAEDDVLDRLEGREVEKGRLAVGDVVDAEFEDL